LARQLAGERLELQRSGGTIGKRWNLPKIIAKVTVRQSPFCNGPWVDSARSYLKVDILRCGDCAECVDFVEPIAQASAVKVILPDGLTLPRATVNLSGIFFSIGPSDRGQI